MGADEDIDLARGQPHQHRLARPALLAPGEDRDSHAEAAQLAEQGGIMLAREDFGRGEECRLRPAFDCSQHGADGDQCLARPDIALEQAKHRRRLRHVAADFLADPHLRASHSIGQFERPVELASAL